MKNFKLYYVIPVIFIIILIVIFFLLPGKKTPPTTIYTTPVILPTEIVLPNQTNSSLSSSSTSPLVPVYTGGANEQLPKDVADLAAQKKALRNKTPLNQPAFIITFDFASDKFIVALNDPKTTSQSAFEDWLKANYPAIPLDRFTFK